MIVSARVSDSVTAVIICMFVHEIKLVGPAIESALAQTIPCDVIVICGPDVELILRGIYAGPRIRMVSTQLCRLGAARNRAIPFIRTSWTAFLDCDDVWRSDKTEKQLAAVLSVGEHVNVVGSAARMVDEQRRAFAYTVSASIPMPSTWLVRTDYFVARPFDDDAQPEDGPWWFANGLEALRVGSPLIDYMVRGNSLSAAMAGRKTKVKLHLLAFEWRLRWLTLLGTFLLQTAYRKKVRFRRRRDWTAQYVT